MHADQMRREAVHHPQHYGGESNPFECVKVLEAWLTAEQSEGFLLGNALKYLCRAGKKGDRLEDLKKSLWYQDRLVKFLEGRK